jgi:hypothetical protein
MVEGTEKVLDRAGMKRPPPGNVVIDGLAMAVPAGSRASWVMPETVRLIRHQLWVNLGLVACSLSHGPPDRRVVITVFLALAMQAGLACASATDFFLGKDEDGLGRKELGCSLSSKIKNRGGRRFRCRFSGRLVGWLLDLPEPRSRVRLRTGCRPPERQPYRAISIERDCLHIQQ